MKFHLPKKLFAAVMAAVISTQSFATEAADVSFDNSVEGVANVTINGGDLSKYYMYGTYLNQPAVYGVVGAASGQDTENNAPIEKFTSATVTMKGGYGLSYLSGYGVGGNVVETDVTVNMEGGEVKTIVGGTHFASKTNRDRNKYGTDPGYSHTSFGYKANYGKEDDPESPRQNIFINVSGGKVGQIRGTHNGHSNSNIYLTYLPAVIKAGDEAIKQFMKSNPAALSGNVNITVTGGEIDAGWVKETFAIQGGGGTGFSTDGTVYITVKDAENTSPVIKGDILAGSSNVYTFVGATDVTIAGGSITGNVYGGGAGHEDAKIAGGPAPTVNGSTQITLSGGAVKEGNIYGAGLKDVVKGNTSIVISDKGTQVDGTIYGGGIESVVLGARTLTVDSSYTGTQAYKVADFTDIAVNADATLAEMTEAKEGTSISIAEGKTLKLTGDKTYTAGNATGGTIYVDGANFELSSADSKLTSDVVLDKHASLDLNGAAVNNTIWVYGCSIKGAESFSGHLIVDGGELELTEPTSADKVTVTNGGSVTGGSLAANKVELIGTNDGATQPDVNTDLTVADNGTITLSGGAVLNVDGSLTLGTDVNIVVDGNYEVGSEIIKVSGDINQVEDIEITFGETKVVVQNGGVWLISRFDQNYADTFTVGNWGIITASRAFVDTVRGQRTNVGCIANGRGTAWAAVMGGNHDIAGSDINLTGAAVGADMKVGRSSSVGVALGYVDGDVKPGSLRSIDQDGTYLAVYGEHGLKKLDATSCLSLDWVAAYGNTESSVNGHGWEQNSLQLNSRLNWNKRINSKVCVNAFGGLEYFASNSNTVADMKTGSIQSLRGEIGVGARYVAWGTPAVTDGKSGLVLAKGCEKLVFNGEIRYINDLERSNPVIRMEGMSGGSTNPGRQGMGIEAGATYRINERWSASANYGFNAMDDSKEHRINAGAAYTF